MSTIIYIDLNIPNYDNLKDNINYPYTNHQINRTVILVFLYILIKIVAYI
jgi:hypothetical protein